MRLLDFERAGFGRFERARAREADALAARLGDVDDARAVRAAVTDGVDFVDEGDFDEAGEEEGAGYVLLSLVSQLIDHSY